MRYKSGDIVKVDLNPVKGHEQGNYRPVVVINEYPLPGDVYLVLPITSKQKTFPFEVILDDRTETQGVILTFQIRTVDLNKRNAKLIERIPRDLLKTCQDNIKRLITE